MSVRLYLWNSAYELSCLRWCRWGDGGEVMAVMWCLWIDVCEVTFVRWWLWNGACEFISVRLCLWGNDYEVMSVRLCLEVVYMRCLMWREVIYMCKWCFCVLCFAGCVFVPVWLFPALQLAWLLWSKPLSFHGLYRGGGLKYYIIKMKYWIYWVLQTTGEKAATSSPPFWHCYFHPNCGKRRPPKNWNRNGAFLSCYLLWKLTDTTILNSGSGTLKQKINAALWNFQTNKSWISILLEIKDTDVFRLISPSRKKFIQKPWTLILVFYPKSNWYTTPINRSMCSASHSKMFFTWA